MKKIHDWDYHQGKEAITPRKKGKRTTKQAVRPQEFDFTDNPFFEKILDEALTRCGFEFKTIEQIREEAQEQKEGKQSE